jgi:hypothetical protein
LIKEKEIGECLGRENSFRETESGEDLKSDWERILMDSPEDASVE